MPLMPLQLAAHFAPGGSSAMKLLDDSMGNATSTLQKSVVLSFTSWLVLVVHRQLHRSSIVDPLNVTPRKNLVRILCVVNAKCNTCVAIVVSF
jgi:hypothetical protein